MTGEIPKSEYDFLSVQLGPEFDECSIAAHELNTRVAELLDTSDPAVRDDVSHTKLSSLDDPLRIDRQFIMRQMYPKSNLPPIVIGSDSGEPFTSQKVELILMQPCETVQSVTERRGWLRNVVETDEKEVMAGPPMLAARVNGSFIPLATMEKRENGQCSWVQLGAEIHDDNIFVTTADEQTSRLDLIESMREFLRDGKFQTPGATLLQFIRQECYKRADAINALEEAKVVRRLVLYAGTYAEGLRTIIYETQDGSNKTELSSEMLSEKSIFTYGRLLDGRRVEVVMTSSKSDRSSARLMAKTQSGLLLPLAELDKKSGAIYFYGQDKKLPEAERRKLVRLLDDSIGPNRRLPLVPNKDLPEDLRHNTKSHSMSSKQKYAVFACMDRCLLEPILGASYVVGSRKFLDSTHQKIDEVVGRYISNPELEVFEGSNWPGVKQALYRYVHQNPVAKFLEPFNVQERLTKFLGPTSPEQESFANKVLRWPADGRPLTGVIPDMVWGNTVAAGYIVAELRTYGDQYELLIKGRPKVKTDAELKTAVELRFDPSRPIKISHLSEEDSRQRLMSLARLLAQLKPQE